MSVVRDGATGLDAVQEASKPISVMDGSSSSKVTVEYHDPSGLFPLIKEDLASRLPLRNLHWKSPNRPLRSIDSLHVDLVPSKDSVHISGATSSGLVPPDPAQSGNRPTTPSGENVRAPSKERRHQIPGLRQTPYLKLYLLRCDDSETYKSNARKQLREWVKLHTPPSQKSSSSSTQENHDAFEWMILHVVVPDTPAASQPRGSSSSSAATGEKEKSNAASRWTRGTTTILEKIKADFNDSSKNAPDRVAQIRLQKEGVLPHMLPPATSITSPSISEGPQEQERVWNDVIAKLKTLILLSFDQRVTQYEEDLKEKDAQRSLPGWNFCTFFILKEGLARGFESVGLVEDALLGYEELSVGLDAIMREQAKEGNETFGGVIMSYSEDLHQQASLILNQSQGDKRGREESESVFHDSRPLNASKKNYRDLILSNNISVFDFRCYLFDRQMSLLLRLGNAHSVRPDLSSKLQPRPSTMNRSVSVDNANLTARSVDRAGGPEDLLSLAELCTRALNFITFAGRLLREDLLNGADAHNTKFPAQFVDNLVWSWTYAALQQVLEDTSTSSLPISKYQNDGNSGSSNKMQSFGGHGKEQKLSFTEPKTMIHPSRNSSLTFGRPSTADPPYTQHSASGQVVYDQGQFIDRPAPRQDSHISQLKTGLQSLAGTRAQLYVVQRRILEQIGKRLDWSIGWAAIIPEKEVLSEVNLDGEDGPSEEMAPAVNKEMITSPLMGFFAAVVVNATSSIEDFRQFYEMLSDLIVKHYMAAGQTKAGESILGDLAALRFELGDFAAAAMYFGRMASLFSESRWNLVEATMLNMYAQCLKKLNRTDEYVRTLLDLLAKSAANRMSVGCTTKRVTTLHALGGWLDDDEVNTTGVLFDLIQYSEQLPKDKTAPMTKYFADITVEPYVRHYNDKDGFQLKLQFRHVLEDDIEIGRAKVRLTSATSAQTKELWLESSEAISLTKGLCSVWLDSNVNTTGPYIVDRILLEAKRIIFSHEPYTKPEASTPLAMATLVSAKSLKAAKKLRVLCFPRIEAFQSRLYLSPFIHIDRQRSMEIECSSGWNEVKHAEIRLKSASAGLRLRSADATVTSGDVVIQDKPNPGVITIGNMSADSRATFQIPYELESLLPELTIRLEVEYFTDKGRFLYHSSYTIPIELPLDVNVHDHFKSESLFSKFNIKTANQIPLQILDVDLDGSEDYDVHAPKKINGPTHVFPKQPLSVTYKVTKKTVGASGRTQNSLSTNNSLALSVVYRCLNEDVLDRVRALFTAAVENSQVRRLARLLIVTFVDRLERRVLPHQFEKIALLDKVDLGSFDDIGWSECIDSIPHAEKEDTRKWLQNWHEKHKTVLLGAASDTKSSVSETAPPSPHPPRRIIITVSLPQTHILHTAALSLIPPEGGSPNSANTAVVGQPIATQLRIKHTRRWAPLNNLVSLANLSAPDDPIDFVYAIEANPDVWLVAGQRRAHFTVKEDEEHTAPVMLIPMRAGNALLPNVEIRARISPKSEAKDDSGEQLNCEIDYLSYGESVMVVPDVRSSTVGIGEIGSSRSTVWLESEGR